MLGPRASAYLDFFGRPSLEREEANRDGFSEKGRGWLGNQLQEKGSGSCRLLFLVGLSTAQTILRLEAGQAAAWKG